MELRLSASCLTCLLTLAAVGCDDDEERTPPPFATGVQSDAPVSQLDDEEKRQICRSYDGYVDAYVGFQQIAYIACLPLSIVLGGGREGCEEELARCVDTFPAPVTIQAQYRDEGACFDSLDQCNASVAELEGCINVNLGFAINILENFSCRSAEDDEQRQRAQNLMDTTQVCSVGASGCGQYVEVF